MNDFAERLAAARRLRAGWATMEAAAAVEDAAAIGPCDAAEEVQLAVERSAVAGDLGDLPAAIAHAERAIEAARGDPRLLLTALRGLAAVPGLPPERAVPVLERALGLARSVGTAFDVAMVEANLGRVLAGSGQPEEAERRLARVTEALRGDPAVADVLLHRALLALRRGAVAEAEPLLRSALAASSDVRIRTGVLRGLGLARLAVGDADTAAEHFRDALARVEGRVPRLEAALLNDLGETAMARGLVAEAATWYQRAAAIEPDPRYRPMFELNLGLAHLVEGRPADAARAVADLDVTELESRRPGWAAVAAVLRAASAAADGRPDDVDAWLDRAVAAATRDPSGLRNAEAAFVRAAADAASRAGDDPEGLGRAARIAGLVPAFEPARALLGDLADRGARLPMTDIDLVRRLGAGGMGEVWLGRARGDGVPVAVKFLTADQAARPGCLEALSREIRAAAALEHRGIARPYDTGRVGPALAAMTRGHLPEGAPFLVMEYAAGSLATWCGRVAWADARRLLLELLDALAHAHARGLVHLDLKPENVLLASADPPGGVRLADFGLARALAAGDRSIVAGTPAYMAPEQCLRADREVGTWTDLYAVGALAWALLTGDPPFRRSSVRDVLRAHVTEPLPPFAPAAPVPEGLAGWLQTLLRKDPGRRFHRAAEAAAALRSLGDAAAARPLRAVPRRPEASAATTFVLGLEPTEGAVVEAGDRPAPGSVPERWRDEAPEGPTPGLALLRLRVPPLVGRAAEQQALWTALRAAAGGEAGVVVVEGAPGTGKSRLLGWLVEQAHEAGASIVSNRAGAGAAPGVADALGRFLRTERLAGAALQAQVARALQLRGASGAIDAAAIADALSGPALTGIEAIAASVAAFATARPVVLALDDADTDPAALGVARELLTSHPDARVLVVLAVSGEAPREWARGAARVMRVGLGPLAPAAARQLLERLVRLEDALAEDVVARTGGHPQFLVELVGDWAARGLLRRRGADRVLLPGARVALPDDLHALWRDRVDGLARDPAERLALELAAALGPRVDLREWARARELAGVPAGLAEALHRRLLDLRLAASTEAGFAFTQAVLRESVLRAAEEGGSAARLHGLAAAALEGIPEAAGRRGRHLLEAGAAEAALAPLVAGIDAAVARSEHAWARELAGAWERAFRASGLPEDDVAARVGLLACARVARAGSDVARQVELGRRALALADAHDAAFDRAEARILVAHGLRRTGDLDGAEALGAEAVTIARALADDDLLGRSLHTHGDTLTHLGRPEAEACLREAVARGRTRARTELANLLRRDGRLDEAEAALREHLAAAGADREQAAVAWNQLGAVRSAAGDHAAAEGCFRCAAELLEALGRATALVPRLNQGYSLVRMGRDAEAEPVLRAVAARAARIDRPELAAGAVAGELAVFAAAGDDEAWASAIGQLRRTQPGRWPSELASMVELAARRATDAGRSARGDEAADLAARAWESLGRPDDAARARAIGARP